MEGTGLGKTTIDMDHLMKMKEEYIFVFSGFNERFVTSIEVFDVTRGIWRDFNYAQGTSSSIASRTKTQVVSIFEDSLAVIGGKDEYGVPTDEIVEFNLKMMKSIPTDWRMPRALSGFACCLLKSKIISIIKLLLQRELSPYAEGMMGSNLQTLFTYSHLEVTDRLHKLLPCLHYLNPERI